MDGTKDFYCDVALQPGAELKKEYESDHVLAYHHTKPFWPVHIVVIPKKHINSLLTLALDEQEIFQEMITVIRQISAKVVQEHGAARVLTNLGEYQDSKHLHFHLSY
jgi:histidine triad (HIT) family protein